MTPEQKDWIDKASLVQLLRRWRHAPLGDTILQGESGRYFSDRLFRLRDASPEAWTAASKVVGWSP